VLEKTSNSLSKIRDKSKVAPSALDAAPVPTPSEGGKANADDRLVVMMALLCLLLPGSLLSYSGCSLLLVELVLYVSSRSIMCTMNEEEEERRCCCLFFLVLGFL